MNLLSTKRQYCLVLLFDDPYGVNVHTKIVELFLWSTSPPMVKREKPNAKRVTRLNIQTEIMENRRKDNFFVLHSGWQLQNRTNKSTPHFIRQ